MTETPKSEKKKEKIEGGIFNRFLRIKGDLAKILGPFLILGALSSKVEAKNFSSELEKALMTTYNIEEMTDKLGDTSYVRASREISKTQKDALKSTREFNDVKVIKEFLKPGSPIGINELYALTIDAPSRFDFSHLVRRKYRDLFICGAKMKWVPNVETLKEGLSGDRYEIKSIIVRVKVHEEGLRRDLMDYILGKLNLKLTVLATIEIKLYNWNTGQYLNLTGFGASTTIGPFFATFDRERAIKEAINNGFDNLEILLEEALDKRVIIIADRAFIISG
jgi:hypothetical protein